MLTGFVLNSGLEENSNTSLPFEQAKQLSNFACLMDKSYFDRSFFIIFGPQSP